MRPRILPVAGISAAALACAMAFAPMASASSAPGVGHSGKSGVSHFAHSASLCYQQGSSLDGNGISSQNFEASFDIYDDSGASDFSVSGKCKIKTVSVNGIYSTGTGTSHSVTVTVYKDAGGVPGAVVKSKTSKKFSGGPNYVVKLGKKGIKLKSGDYWVGVVDDRDFSTGGQWYWATATDGGGGDDQWENPGGGFGLPQCMTWCDATNAGATSPEFSYSLS
jgi:hypothetical protein